MNDTRFQQIVFMDDLFRSSDNLLPSHPVNRRFLARAMGASARRLGIACREWSPSSEGGEIDVASLMSALSLPRGLRGWSQACTSDPELLAQCGLLPALDATTLVIGWGLPPSLARWIDNAGAAFVDVEISPVRFATNLMFCLRTNDPLIEAALSSWRIDEERLWSESALLQGYYARRGARHIFSPDLRIGLFCGQTCVDLALVHRGEIAQPTDVLAPVLELSAGVDLLLFKPHPYEPKIDHLRQLAAQVPNAAWTDENVYALLCAENLDFVCALTSGILREADYFQKSSLQLLDPDRNNPALLPASCSPWMTLDAGILSLDALAAICSRGDVAVPPRPTSVPQDALDRAFDARWGFQPHHPGLSKPPLLELGRTYDFGGSPAAMPWLTFGWGQPEGAGVWSIGEHACVVMPLEPRLPDEHTLVTVVVEGQRFAPAAFDQANVRAWVNGDRASAASAKATVVGDHLRFTLDALIAGSKEPSRALVIEFEIIDPQRPCDHGMSGDDRRLGFFLERLGVNLEEARPRVAVPRLSPAFGYLDRHRRVALLAVIAFLAAFGLALMQARYAEVAQLEANSGQVHQIGHELATQASAIRSDIHALLKSRHS